MEPLTLALKIICQPHLAMIYLLEYAQQEEQLQETYEFRKDISDNLRRIHNLLLEKYELNRNNISKINATSAQEVNVDHIDAIGFLEFSPQNLISMLSRVGPIRIGNVLLAQLISGQGCDVPVYLAQLTHVRVFNDHRNLILTFDNVYGRFWRNKRTKSEEIGQRLKIPIDFKGIYHGEITVKNITENVQFSIGRKHRIRTISSSPVLSVRDSTILYMKLETHQRILREIIILEH